MLIALTSFRPRNQKAAIPPRIRRQDGRLNESMRRALDHSAYWGKFDTLRRRLCAQTRARDRMHISLATLYQQRGWVRGGQVLQHLAVSLFA